MFRMCAFDVRVIIKSWLYIRRCSVLEVVCGGCSAAQEPGGGASDGGAGVQRGHAAHAGALHRTHCCHLHSSTLGWYGNQDNQAVNKLCFHCQHVEMF